MKETSPAERLKGELAALDGERVTVSDGSTMAERRARAVDVALMRLFAPFVHPSGEGTGRLALVAIGGYGRSELTPGSDIDLMILHEDRDRGVAERAAAAVLYPLWDLGAPTGHAMRTPEDCRAEAGADVRTLTALLDARLIGGSRSLLSATLEWITRGLHSAPVDFVRSLYQSREERRKRFGLLSHSQSPDLRDCLGGLRDIHLLGWLARGFLDYEDPGMLTGPAVERDPAGLEWLRAEGFLRESEAADCARARPLLLAVRAALHVRTQTASNVLAVDEQAGVAERLDVRAEPDWEPRDALVRDVLRAGRRVDLALEACLERVRASARGVELSTVVVLPERPFPESALESLAVSARERRPIESAALEHFEEDAQAAGAVSLTPGTLSSFLEILGEGEAGARALELADAIGLIGQIVPNWDLVAGRAQRDPYHRYPVDVHLLRAAAAVASIVAEPEDAFEREAVEQAGDPRPLLMGAFLHDVGKVGRGSHVPIGEETARQLLEGVDVAESFRQDVLFLVREHLLLSDSATRRNIDDEDLVLTVASQVDDQRKLAMLYLLSVADARATGPSASSPWRIGLVRELVAKANRALEHGLTDPGRPARLAQAEAAIRASLAPRDERQIEAFLDAVPTAYLMGVPAEEAPGHVALVVPPPAGDEVRIAEPRPGRAAGTYRLGVGARDRPGLLATMAGSFTLSGLSILSAQVFTTAGGVVLDLFDVRGAFEAEVGEDRWQRFRETLTGSLGERLSLAERVAELREHYRAAPADIPVTVRFDQEASDFYTVVEVGVADRFGLLFDLASAFAHQDVDVHLAKVATYGPRVVDVFYVTDLSGRKLGDDTATLSGALRAAAS